MTLLWLAARLARAGGRLRTASVIGGCAVGSLVMLVACAVPGTLGSTLTGDQRRLVTVVLLVVALPVVALLAAVTRLSAATRDRRLASLRILGLGAASTRAVAAAETTLLAAVGTVIGVVLFLAVRPALEAADAAGQRWFVGRMLEPGPAGWAAGTLGVVVLALCIAASPGRAVTSAPLSTRRQATAPRPSLLRLLPVTVGLALLIGAVLTREGSTSSFWLFLSGTAVTGLGLPLATPVGVRLLADLTAGRADRPAPQLAARRLQQEPAGSARLVAALLVGTFVVTGALSVLAVFTTTPQYARAERAATRGPQAALVTVPAEAGIDAAALRAVPGVRALAPRRTAQLACTPAELDAAREYTGTPPPSCSSAVVATCAELPALRIEVTGCVDGQAAWLLNPYPGARDPITPTPTLVTVAFSADGTDAEVTAELPLPPVDAQLQQRLRPADPSWTSDGQVLLVPPGTPGVDAFVEHGQWAAVLSGGSAALQRFTAAASAQGLTVYSLEDLQPYTDVRAYQVLLWTVAAVVLGVGLLALLVTGIDRAVERRRHLAALATIGVPGGVVRRSQFLQAAAPVAVGLPLAGGAGLLAGAGYLSYAGASWALPWISVAGLTAVGLAGGLAVAAATVAGLGGRVRPAELRRE